MSLYLVPVCCTEDGGAEIMLVRASSPECAVEVTRASIPECCIASGALEVDAIQELAQLAARDRADIDESLRWTCPECQEVRYTKECRTCERVYEIVAEPPRS